MDRRGSRAWLLGCALVLMSLAGAATAFAQQGQATLTGTVVDNAGVVPGATVTISNAASAAVRTATTDGTGVWRIPTVPPGQYTVKVEMQGFKELTTSLTLLSGETRDLGKMTMSVGGRTETVNVTAEVTPVQTSSSALTKNLSGDMLTQVQVKGRDVFGMLKLLPGVVDGQTSRDFAQWNSGRYLSINGSNSLTKNTTIDGVPSGEEGGNGTTHITPNIDSVAEVNVITNGYAAENGRGAGGQIIMTTKSGTNQLKGSAWYNGRRDWMNKNDFFRLKSGNAKPFFSVNIYGFSVGGPVIVPGVVDSRKSDHKTFFFGSTEQTQDVRPTAVSYINLPTSLERAGDFSQTFSGKATGTRDGQFNSGVRTLVALKNPYPTLTDFFCNPGTGGLSGVSCAGTANATNILNPKYFNAMGASMLNLLPLPNGQHNPAADQFNNANDASDTLPLHTRKNYLLRIDQVLSNKIRFSGRYLRDRDDSTTYNAMAQHVGSIDNIYNGDFTGGTMTWVVKPTVVNEVSIGYTSDHWGFKYKPGALEAGDYTQWYRGAVNPLINKTLPDPPRLGPYQDATTDALLLMGTNQAYQLPFFPDIAFGGGNYSNYGQFRPSGGNGPLPRQNFNPRYTFSDDLSMVKGRHSFKVGFSTERNAKTEPGGAAVNGSFNFGENTSNPLSTTDGYANALLGIYTGYAELDRRADRNDTHWLGEAYAQDTWRLTPRFTLDYGVRFTHNGSMFEPRGYNSGFDPSLYKASQIPQLFTPFCTSGAANNATCASASTFSKNPVNGAIVSRAFQGTVVPATQGGTGTITNGMFLGGLPGKKPGEYDSLKYMQYGPRVGFAWDVFGNGKTAIRGASGVFYNFFSCCNYPYNGGPLLAVTRNVINGTIPQITEFSQSGNLAVSPAGAGIPIELGATKYLAGQDIQPDAFQASRHYQANFAVQRDIGFNTVVEVAYVGNWGRHYYQGKTVNNIPVDAYANSANLFNNDAIAANFIRRNFPGMGALTYVTSDYVGLNYNSLQISAQRRLAHGLQMGGSYTLARGLGMRGWDFRTEELGGAAALKAFYYGPIAINAGGGLNDQGQDRRHVAVFNYSYQIPTINKPVLKWVLGGWEAAGVTTIVTGDAVNPVCNNGSGTSGIANTDPSLSGVGTRCELVPGQALLSGYDPTGGVAGVAFEDQAHFNLAAFQRPLPTNTAFSAGGSLGLGATGNLGNAPYGLLRNPGWSNWDFTLSRRLPIKVGHGGNVRLQLQFYNLFNQVEFNQMQATYSFTTATPGNPNAFGGGNTSTTTGKYTGVQNPYNFSFTMRFDY